VQVKGFVAINNTTFRLKDVKELTYAAFGKNTKDVCGQKQENMWSKLKKNIAKKTV
jgi:transcription initiation factor IIE alpha subunit